MRLKTKLIVAGVVVGGITIAAGTVAIARAIKKRTKQVLKRNTRKVMADILVLRGEDFIPGGETGLSIFREYIDGLSDKQLVALFALVQVGYFIKASGIDPLHPSKEQFAKAVEKYLLEERLAPKSRAELVKELDTSDAHDALGAAFNVLSAQ